MLSPRTMMTGLAVTVALGGLAARAASGIAEKAIMKRPAAVFKAAARGAARRTFNLRLTMQKKSDPVIEVRGLTKKVKDATGELTILDNIDLLIEASSRVAIVGASGSGKSTLLGLLAGLDSATSGSVRLLGRELSELDEDGRAALRSGSVGFVFQSFQLMPHLTALENVTLPLELQGGMAARDIVARARTLLTQVGLAERMRHYPKLLSGGEQQRVALARA